MTLNDWLGIYFCSFSSSQPPSPLPLPHFGTLLLLLYPDPGSEILGFAKLRKREYLKLKREGTGGRKGSLPSVFPPQPLFPRSRAYIFAYLYTLTRPLSLSESLEPAPLLSINGGEVKVMHACHPHFCNMYLPTILLTCWKKKRHTSTFLLLKADKQKNVPPEISLKILTISRNIELNRFLLKPWVTK